MENSNNPSVQNDSTQYHLTELDRINHINYQRLKFVSIVILAFSIIALATDFMPLDIWDKEHVVLFKILDAILFLSSLSAVVIFWYIKPKNTVFRKLVFNAYFIISIIWTGLISGIDFSEFGLTTFVFVFVFILFTFHFNAKHTIAFFILGLLALFSAIMLFGNPYEVQIDKLITLGSVLFVSFFIARRNFTGKIKELNQSIELQRLNKALEAAKENLEYEVTDRTRSLTMALEEKSIQQVELKQAYSRFSSLIRNLQSGIFYINTEGQILETNPAMLKILGSPSEEKTKAINVFKFKPLIEIGYTEKLKECIETGEIVEGEATYTSMWGKKAIVHFYFAPIKENDDVIGVLANNEDVTKEIQWETELAEKNDALSRQNEEFEALNEELMQTNDELFAAKVKAEESDKLKTVFLNNMSHEIRTPLNGIVGFSGILSRPDLSPEKRNNFIQIIKNSSDQLLRVINDILEISVLETKQVKVINEEVQIKDFLHELFSIFDFKAKERGISLRLNNRIKPGDFKLITDKSKLSKIISNLIENALKYTSEGFVEIGCERNESLIFISVRDSGVGIDLQNQERVFERFAQESTDITVKKDGLGIGLSIIKENVKLLGGTITLDSEKGKGACFTIILPLKPPANENSFSNYDE